MKNLNVNELSKTLRSFAAMSGKVAAAIEQYEAIPPDYIKDAQAGTIGKKKPFFRLPFVSRKAAGEMALKAAEITTKDLRIRHQEDLTKALNRQTMNSDRPNPDKQVSFIGGDFASMQAFFDAEYTEEFLRNGESKFAESLEAEFFEALGRESGGKLKYDSLEDVKNKEEKERYSHYLESSRRIWAGMFGAHGIFSSPEYDFQFSTMSEIRKQANMRYQIDPHIGGFIDSILSYIVGTGIKFKCSDPECHEYLEREYWNFNVMENYHKERVLKVLLNGEQFAKYHVTDAGRMVVFQIDPDYITEIEYEDRFNLAYKEVDENGADKEWHLDVDYEEHTEKGLKSKYESAAQDKDKVFHMKIGLGTRGKPIALRVLRYAQYYEDFVRDCQRHWHEQSRCIIVKTVSKSSTDYDEVGNIYPSVSGGLMLVAVKDEIEYQFMSPQMNSGGADVLGRMLRMSLSTGFRTPEVVGFVDASESVYASIKTTMNPFTYMIMDYQDLVKSWHGAEARLFLQRGIDNGDLKEKVKIKTFDQDKVAEAAVFVFESISTLSITELDKGVKDIMGEPKIKEVDTIDVPIEFILPDVIEQNIKELTDAYKVHDEMGWAHKSLISTKLGWPYQLVKVLREQDRLEMQKQDQDYADKIRQGLGVGKVDKKKDDEDDK